MEKEEKVTYYGPPQMAGGAKDKENVFGVCHIKATLIGLSIPLRVIGDLIRNIEEFQRRSP